MNAVEIVTEYQPKYWNCLGKYQKELERLQAELIPESGKAKTMHGELLRCVSKIYYDVFNNGWGNREAFNYHLLFMLNFETELKAHGLSDEDFKNVNVSLKYPSRKMSIWEDLEFVQSLDNFMDSVVKHVAHQDHQ
jgi:hypothetical protein